MCTDVRVFYWYQGDLGEGTSVEILSKFWSECRNTFLPKSRIFRKFSRYFYTITPKITFYCIFINKFHKNFEKSAQKFFAAPSAPRKTRFRRLRRRKRVEISPFFHPWSVDGTPPLEGSPPPPNLPDTEQTYFWRRVTPQRGGLFLQPRGQKMEIFLHVFGAEGAENVFFCGAEGAAKFF